MNLLQKSLIVLALDCLVSLTAFAGIPLADQKPVLFLDFSKQNWRAVSSPYESGTQDYVVKDIAGQNDFVGVRYQKNYRAAACRNHPGNVVLQMMDSSVRQVLTPHPNQIALHQGEDFTIAGWYRFDPKNPAGQVLFAQRGDVNEPHFGPDTSWILNFDGNGHGNSYYFIMNRQTIGNVTVLDPGNPSVGLRKRVFAEQPDLYSDAFLSGNMMRQQNYQAYLAAHAVSNTLLAAKLDVPIPRKNLKPMKPLPPGLPPELPPEIPGPVSPPLPPLPPPPSGGPPVDQPPPPPILTTIPTPPNLPGPYTAKDHVYMDHGFDGDSGADCWTKDAGGNQVHKQCWHFIAISYTFQDPLQAHAEIYFYRVNPFSQMLELKQVQSIPREGLEASRPINVRNNFFRIGEHSDALFKDVAVYKKALDSRQVYTLAHSTAPIGPAFSCDYDDYVSADLGL